MNDQNVSPEVGRFLADHIASVAQLELLLLLRTTAPRQWTVEELTRELRVESAWASSQLKILVDHGLLVPVDAAAPAYIYRPGSEELTTLVTAVAQAYLLHRVTVTEMIYSHPAAGIRAFSDAFRLRKEAPRG